MKRPMAVWLLVFLLVFLALGGLYGGIAMLADPSGQALQMQDVLQFLPVPNYILPGLFLTIVMGLAPLLLAYGLVTRPTWRWAHTLSAWSNQHWAWTGSVLVAAGLLLWLTIQAFLIGFRWPIQYVTLANGALILFVALLPGLRTFYRL